MSNGFPEHHQSPKADVGLNSTKSAAINSSSIRLRRARDDSASKRDMPIGTLKSIEKQAQNQVALAGPRHLPDGT